MYTTSIEVWDQSINTWRKRAHKELHIEIGQSIHHEGKVRYVTQRNQSLNEALK